MAWIIDEFSTFQINNLRTFSVEEIGRTATKVVSIRNFYKNPDSVRDLIQRSPVTRWPQIVKDYPAFGRIKVELNTTALTEVIHQTIDEVYNVRMPQRAALPFMANVLVDRSNPLAGTCVKPHFDTGADFAAVIYMNTPEECSGGTGFYRHRPTGCELAPTPAEIFEHRMDFGTYDVKSPFFTDSDSRWELIHLAEMEYNKLVIYPARLFHSLYMRIEDFREFPRINQVLFMNALGS